jgi:stringent starvation protein B
MPGRTTSKQRPYLIRAMHEWMADNGLTPHIVADASFDGLEIPVEHVKDGKIVLNVSLTATRELVLGNEYIDFEARFNGVPRRISVPVGAVLGIYARETGQGMVFSEESPPDPDTPETPPDPEPPGKPHLKVVK